MADMAPSKASKFLLDFVQNIAGVCHGFQPLCVGMVVSQQAGNILVMLPGGLRARDFSGSYISGRNIVRQTFVLHGAFKEQQAIVSGWLIVKLLDNIVCQPLLALHGMGQRLPVGQQGEPLVHHGVGDGHDLAENIPGRLVEKDAIAEGFAHLPPIGAVDDRQHQAGLGRLALKLLQLAGDLEIKQLILASDFDFGVEGHRIPALEQRHQQFVHPDGLLVLDALLEGIAGSQMGQGKFGHKAHKLWQPHIVVDIVIAAEYEALGQELFDLLHDGLCVALCGGFVENGPGGVSS